jgi:hypothetical protein
MNEANLKSLNKILLNVEKMDSLIAGILNSSIENHTHEERVIDVNLVARFLKTIEVPDNEC